MSNTFFCCFADSYKENCVSQTKVGDLPHGGIDVVIAWVSRVDHESVDKLHSLGSLSTKLSRHDNLATLGTRLHDETEDTIASPKRREKMRSVSYLIK